jgi:hypothetical protein
MVSKMMVPGVGACAGHIDTNIGASIFHLYAKTGSLLSVNAEKKIPKNPGQSGNNRPETHVIKGNLAITDNEC